MDQKVYQIKDVQKITGLCRNKVSALIANGQLKSIRLGRRVIIPAWALDEFLSKAN